MLFGTAHKLKIINHQPLRMNNEVVERVNTFKYLGVYLDTHLTFDFHIDKVYKKTCSKVGLLKKVRYLVDRPTASTLYKSLVLPHLDYCDVVYVTAKQESLNKLQLIQNVACRTILLADKYSNVENMHKELGLNYLDDRRKFHFGNLCHKNVFPDGLRSGLLDFFKRREVQNVRASRRVGKNDVVVPNCKSQISRKSISYRGPKFWNDLPNNIKDIVKFSIFVNRWKAICFPNFVNHPT